jgi:rhodanese-related sulfurtransferase/Fe-S cluster assembly iron-binding protein IscA
VLMRSVDGGKTWGGLAPGDNTPLPVSNKSIIAGVGCHVAIGPSGEVYVTWYDNQLELLMQAKSTDRGQSFTPAYPIAGITGVDDPFEGEAFRNLSIPSTAVDRKGNMYVAVSSQEGKGAPVLAGAQELGEALQEGTPGDVIHLTITPAWEHQLDLGPREASHVTVQSNGVTLQLDRGSAGRGNGVTIDFIEASDGAGFKIDNPNRPATVKEIPAKELKALLDSGRVTHLYDVRTDKERGIAKIAGTTQLDDAAMAAIEALPKDTALAFHCHHGGRSRGAAEHFLKLGFKNVYNLAGGIEAWSRDVDPSVPRY